MKKTIAILLVLVIGMAGVFAANNSEADMKITTEISEFFKIFVTETNTAIADWDTYTQTVITKAVDTTYTTDFGSVAYVQARSNNVEGYNIKVKASSLYSTTSEALIKYEVKIGDGTVVASNATATGGYNADISSDPTTTSKTIAGTGSLITINEAINVKLNATDYENAGAANDYDAKIYIEYSAI